PLAKKLLEMGYELYATPGTHDFMKYHGLRTTLVFSPLSPRHPNVTELLEQRKIDLVINLPKSVEEEDLTNDYLIRRKAIDFNIPLITNLQVAERFIEALSRVKLSDLAIKSWEEY
ncbi:MAG: carbamoyl phosphate synthase large subunit, partial [Candidatus Aminicenantes bacterium]